MDWKIAKFNGRLRGELCIPPDKSISHRAVLFGSIAKGICEIHNFLFGEDCLRTLEAFRAMGIEITKKDNSVVVSGKGLKGLKAPNDALYLGNSGTTMRILPGVLAGQNFNTVLTGDESLSQRPMRRIIEPLSMMGAEITGLGTGMCAPLSIKGKSVPLNAIDYILPMASAQVKSCILTAGLYAEGKTHVTEPFQSRDHTERLLEYFSVGIKRKHLTTEIMGFEEFSPKDMTIPADISSAAFFIIGALLIKGSRLIMRGVGLNPTRIGIINVLKRMGANLEKTELKDDFEPVGVLDVRSSDLKGVVVEENEIPLLIDEVPILSVAAALSEGNTFIKGIKELKVKETDRIKAIIDNLSKMGVKIEEKDNGIIIYGKQGFLKAARLNSYGDHRIAMSMAIAALKAENDCYISDVKCVDTSYPGFLKDLEKIKK